MIVSVKFSTFILDEQRGAVYASISLDDHKGSIEFYWNDLVDSNPNLRKHLYLPIFSTHSPSFFFLIGMDDETFGKIFEYDSDFEDFVPKEIASNFNDFFEDKIYCKFSVHSKAKFGAIEIFRHNGVEIWDVTSSHLSITNINGIKSLNFWVESDHVHLEELEDTGDTSIMFEIKFPISMIADFSNPWKFDYPLFEEISDEWGEESNLKYYDNFYYYSHESFDKQSIEIVKSLNSYFYVRIKGEKDDPLSAEYGKAKFNITVRTKMENKFNGLWCEE